MTKGLSHLYASNGDTTVPKNPGVSEVFIDNMPQGGGGGGAVDSVNGKTGTVVLDASDVGALPASTPIPSKTSDLTNDSGFITSSDIPAQVQADWSESDSSDPSYIQNKPTIPTATSDLTNDSGFITSSDIPAQVNADWNETDPSDPSYIENKPSIPAAQVNSDWNAASGVAQILNKPSIPTATSDLTNDSGFITSSDIPAQVQADWSESDTTDPSYIQNKPEDYTLTAGSNVSVVKDDNNKTITIGASFTQVQANWNESDSSDPSYIQNKPTIPTVDQTYDATSANAQSGVAVASAISAVPQVPASTSADEGKVLTVDSNGDAGWATPATPAGGDSDEWWGGDPGVITVGTRTVRIMFKDKSYNPNNDPDTTFLAKFASITKIEDGVYDFVWNANQQANAFKDKYLTDNEFVILGLLVDGSTNSMFEGCTGLKAVYNVCYSGYGSLSANYMFRNCANLVFFSTQNKATSGNLDDYRMGAYRNMRFMFQNCKSLTECRFEFMFDASSQSNVDTSYMFSGCEKLVKGPAFSSCITNSSDMFSSCFSLREFTNSPVNLGDFALSGMRDCYASNMFYNCRSLRSIDHPFFIYSTLTNAQSMFEGCSALITTPRIKLSSSGATLNKMFYYCESLKELPELDYSLATRLSGTFNGCATISDISRLKTVAWNASLTNVDYMFKRCWSITEGLKDVYDNMAATATITSHSDTFKECGLAYSNAELAQIPTSWGGTAT